MLFPLQNPIFKRIFPQNERKHQSNITTQVYPSNKGFLVARPEGFWPLELDVVKHGAKSQYIKVHQSIWKVKFDKGLLLFMQLIKSHIQNVI